MGPAHLGVILDSSIVIEAERQRLNAARFLKYIAGRVGEREAALCSISVAELAHGIYRADSLERRQARRAFLDDLKAPLAIYPITADTAELVGRFLPNRRGKVSPSLSTTCSSAPAPSSGATRSPRATSATSKRSPGCKCSLSDRRFPPHR